jgi:hypothetical protein
MTRADWLTCGDPAAMLHFLRDRASDRKLRLFAVAWGRDVWRLLPDERSRDAVLTAERYADGAATVADLVAAHRGAADAVREIPLAAGRRTGVTRRQADRNWATKAAAEVACCAADPAWDVRAAASAAGWTGGATRYALSNHLRDLFNPFRPAPFDPAWRTSTARAMGAYAYESGDLSALPILADALQDAGCEDAEVLAHCRDATSPHCRGCWVVDCVLGRE